MSYSYDFLQARLSDLYEEAEHQRSVTAARRRAGTRWPTFGRRRPSRDA